MLNEKLHAKMLKILKGISKNYIINLLLPFFTFLPYFLQTLQILEDQKKKLDAFCEQSYKNVSVHVEIIRAH